MITLGPPKLSDDDSIYSITYFSFIHRNHSYTVYVKSEMIRNLEGSKPKVLCASSRTILLVVMPTLDIYFKIVELQQERDIV